MQLELKRLQHEFGITFVIVTHDQEEALVMADRIALMKDGALLQVGPPQEIYENPRSRFVADFIGVMNFLPVDAMAVRSMPGTAASCSHAHQWGAGEGAAVAAVRPERLSRGQAGENRLEGRVSAIAYHGLDLHLHVESVLSDTPVIVRLTADVADSHRPGTGQQLALSWSARDTHIFPA